MNTGTVVGLIKSLAPGVDPEQIETAVDSWLDDHPEATTTVQDGAISYSKLDSSLKEKADDVTQLKNALQAIEGWTPSMKTALLQCFQHVKWDDAHGDEYYDDLYNALYPPVSITAVYDSTHIASISDTLDSLKPYLTVTAHYNGSPDAVITDYTLSGSLNVGNNTITVSFVGLQTTFVVVATEDANVVDVCLFAGQSNMDGRGTASEAPTVAQGTAYKWDSTNNTVVDFTSEGSLIPAFVKEYYELTHIPIVEVKEAVGGTAITPYITTNLPYAKQKLENCINYLENNGKTVRRCFMLWNQGESDVDGDQSTGTSAYESAFATLKTSVMASGVEDIFIINIGQASNGNYDFSPIRTALVDVCNGSDVVMVSDKFYNATDYMGDTWHYEQIVYNTVGEDAAKNTVAFFNGQTISVKKFDASDIYGIPSSYGTLDDWSYDLHSTRVVLSAYNGSNPSVHVYHLYLASDNAYYEARIQKALSPNHPTFYNNTVISDIIVDDGVKMINPSNYNEADNQQNLTEMFKGMTALESVEFGNTPIAVVGAESMFQGTSKLNEFNFIDRLSGNFRYAFRDSGITYLDDLTGVTRADDLAYGCTNLVSVGSIDGTYTTISGAFRGCTKLESVGVIKSTALTDVGSMFYGCTSLTGVIKFLSSSITNATGMLNNVDRTKIEIQVPANSTSYTTITTAWPDANVTTF